MLKIAVLDDYQGVAKKLANWSSLEDSGVRVDIFREHLDTPDAIVAALKEYEVIVLMRERTTLTRSVIEQLPRLELVVTTAMHNRTLDFRALGDAGVLVCGTESLHASTVEHAWALILSAARHVPTENQNVLCGRWQTTVGTALTGKVLGLVGVGHIGARMIPIARAFGMHVIGWSPNLGKARTLDLGIERVGKIELFERSDVVSLHLVLSEATRGIVGRDELSAMKQEALLVNSARGALIDEDALVEALEAGSIGGAAIDVYQEEPLPQASRLRALPRCVMTPHIGFVTDAEYSLFYEQIVEDLRAFLVGKPIRVITG